MKQPQVKCPRCDTMSPKGRTYCSRCGFDFTAGFPVSAPGGYQQRPGQPPQYQHSYVPPPTQYQPAQYQYQAPAYAAAPPVPQQKKKKGAGIVLSLIVLLLSAALLALCFMPLKEVSMKDDPLLAEIEAATGFDFGDIAISFNAIDYATMLFTMGKKDTAEVIEAMGKREEEFDFDLARLLVDAAEAGEITDAINKKFAKLMGDLTVDMTILGMQVKNGESYNEYKQDVMISGILAIASLALAALTVIFALIMFIKAISGKKVSFITLIFALLAVAAVAVSMFMPGFLDKIVEGETGVEMKYTLMGIIALAVGGVNVIFAAIAAKKVRKTAAE